LTDLLELWMPVLVSAVIVFVASSIIHMGPFWHRKDFPALPQQDRVQDALRPFQIAPGDYMLPRGDCHADMKSPEFLEKWKRGPVAFITVLPNGVPTMGRSLSLWFLYCIVVSIFAGYVASRGLASSTEYIRVFQLVGATAFVGFVLAGWQAWIWQGRGVKLMVTMTIDGLIYACLTAGTFGWLWPR